MEDMTCPKCSSTMAARSVGDVTVHQCSSCRGVFLDRADLGNLVEAENDWHSGSGHHTQPLPRITADMTAPPPTAPRARSYLDSLFR
jgi:Zn-finger nucleic acid-binding protein